MLKEQLQAIALTFFTVPEQYELYIDDFEDGKAKFMWQDQDRDEGYYVELQQNGKLISLSQPRIESTKYIAVKEQQHIAEQFLKNAYEEALDYFTLSKISEKQDGTQFKFEQFVGDIPLAGSYCIILIAPNGQVLDFNYKGYTKNPSRLPETLASKEAILAKLFEADWTLNMTYLSSDYYSVPSSGLYMLYESSILHCTFDAETGGSSIENNDDAYNELFAPLPNVSTTSREETIESIIGIPPSMEIVRQSEIEEGVQSIVWREKEWQAPNDKSMNSFILDRFEQTVKASINVSTNKLKGFAWFKERTGKLDLTFEACRNIAVSFIATYYRDYVPYLKMKIEEPSFNEVHRAFFTFPVTVDGHQIDGEYFMISVNKTTGYIDMLMTPTIEISTIEAYTTTAIQDLSIAKHALKDVDCVLQWEKNYATDEPQEILKYTFKHHGTKQSIKGLNAVTGELILIKF